jgi:hypothetical protein
MSSASDVFVSYAREDRDRIKVLVQILEAQGWNVWWDPDIAPGKPWREVIEQALARTRSVLVVWSNASVSNSWVQGEADEGMRRSILVPVLIDDNAKIPLGFGHIQFENLSQWSGNADDPRIRQVLSSIHMLHQVGEVKEVKEEQARQRDDLQEILLFVLQNFVSEYELVHLKKLGSGKPFPFTPSKAFELELRRLLSIRLIARQPGHGIRTIMSSADDLNNHLVITDRGKSYLKHLRDLESRDAD